MPAPTELTLDEALAAAPPDPASGTPPSGGDAGPAKLSPMDEAFAALDTWKQPAAPPDPAKAAESGKPEGKTETPTKGASSKPPEKPGAPAKPRETKAAETPKPSETPKPAEAPKAGEAPAKPKRPSDYLRDELTKVKAERDSVRAELDAVKKSKTVEDPEKKTISEELQKERQRREQLEEKLRFTDYSQSDEFQEKYYKPYVEAYQKGRSKTMSFNVTDADGNTRKATADDFDAIMALGDSEAAEKAVELFGERAANLVLWHRERVLEANESQMRALDEFRKTGSERQKKVNEAKLEQGKKASQMFSYFNKRWTEQHPEWFKPVEGDAKGNELLEKGLAEADLAFNIPPDMPLEKQVALHSKIRNQAAAFGRLVHQLEQRDARIAELEKELEDYHNSLPGEGEGAPSGGATTPAADTLDGALAGLDKYAKSTSSY